MKINAKGQTVQIQENVSLSHSVDPSVISPLLRRSQYCVETYLDRLNHTYVLCEE